jgi:predicted ATPase/class 3 adenylate cyclase
MNVDAREVSMMGIASVLQALGLERYLGAFTAADVDLNVLKLLTEDDLRELGLSLGHRRKLLAAIADGLPLASADFDPPQELQAVPCQQAQLSHPGGQERRPVTVMLCDMVGSTELTQRLGLEEMGRIIRQFQDSTAGAVSRFEGFVDRFMGDAVLSFFGYPRAHEDAAERAVRAALAIVDGIGEITAPDGEAMSVRIAISSGAAFFGGIVEHGGAREPIVTGEVVNLAARLQQIAPVNGIVVSPQTRRLLREMFEVADMGLHDFKGIGRPTLVWRVTGERLAGTRFEAAHGRALAPIVGRDAEIAMLKDRWQSARAGEGQAVLLSGEAGMGKSRIAQMLREHMAGEVHVPIRFQCSPYHRNSALYPVIAHLRHAARILPGDPPEIRLQKLEALVCAGTPAAAEAVVLLAELLSIPVAPRYQPLDLPADQRKRRTLEVLLWQLLALARDQPVLLLVEDAHWIDPTTQELLSQTIVNIQNAALLMLVTYRPEFEPGWANLSHVTTLALSGLPRRQAMAIVTYLTGGKPLPPELLDQILAKTDGIPLFVEELAKAILELGVLRDAGDRYELISPLPTLAIPDTLQDSLLARLDSHPTTKELAQIGSVIGREFAFSHLSALATLKGEPLNAAIRELLRADLVHQRGPAHRATYVFKHALIQDAAYSTLVMARRQQLHGQCATILVELSPDLAELQPELLAHHYTQAGKAEEAIGHWLKAGRRAIERSANSEAIAHLRQGIALVPGIYNPDLRSGLELRLQVELGVPLIATDGYAAPATLAAWERAGVLAEQRGEHRLLIRSLYGLWAGRTSMGETRTALGLASRILQLGLQLGDDGITLVGHRAHALNVFLMGDLAAARAELEGVLAAYNPERHAELRFEFGQDMRVAATAILSTILSVQGYQNQALRMSAENVECAAALAHTNSLAYALSFGACMVAMVCGDAATTLQFAERLIALATRNHLFLWTAYGEAFKGWALAQQGDADEAVRLLGGALQGVARAGAALSEPLIVGVMGAALSCAGQHEDALASMSAAVAAAERREELWCLPELLRLKAQVVSRLGGDEAPHLLESALGFSGKRGMHSWTLRVACDLAALMRSDGRFDEADALLRSALDSFPEASDAPDRQQALAHLTG